MLTAGDDENHHLLLDRAVREGIVPCTVVALNSDEPELVYWALGLLHEIALKQGNINFRTPAMLLPCPNTAHAIVPRATCI